MMKCPKCGTEAEPSPNLHFLEYTYADNIRMEHTNHPQWSMERIINTVNQEFKGCPIDDDKNPCKNALAPVARHLLNIPKVLAFGLVWSSSTPKLQEIMNTLQVIQNEITLKDLYTSTDSDIQKSSYRLRGMICYYGKHYNAYFFNEELSQWIVFDDATVKHVGDTWNAVLNRCRLGHFHPSVLFYELNSPLHDNFESESQQLQSSYFSMSCIVDNETEKMEIDSNPTSTSYQTTNNNKTIGGKIVSNGIPKGYKQVFVPFSISKPASAIPGFAAI